MIIDVIIIWKAIQCISLYAFFYIWSVYHLHTAFPSTNTSKMHLGQKNEVTSLKAFTIKKIHNLKLEDEAKLSYIRVACCLTKDKKFTESKPRNIK